MKHQIRASHCDANLREALVMSKEYSRLEKVYTVTRKTQAMMLIEFEVITA